MARVGRGIVLVSFCLSGLPFLPCLAEGTTAVAALSGVAGSPDPVLQRAIDYLKASEEAQKRRERRDHIKPSASEKVVRFHEHAHDKIMILGGGAAIPM